MFDVAIDDDQAVAHWAQRFLAVGTRETLLGGVLAAIGIAVAWAAEPVTGLLLAVAGVGLVWHGRYLRRNTRWVRGFTAGDRPSMRLDAPGGSRLVIDHPALPAALALPLTELHSFAIDTAPADRLHAERRFPIYRAPGSIHLGYEPRSFAAVPLAVVHLGTGPLNVGLLFSAPRPLTVLGPPDGDRTGWVHREVLLPWEVFMRGGGSRLLYRRERTVQAAGVFFRLQYRDVLELVRLLTSLGVRQGFNCQDWSHATGIPHP